MDFLIAHKTSIILFCEVTAWFTTFLCILSHYKWGSKIGFYAFGEYALNAGWVPHIFIIVYDLWEYHKISLFDVFIIGLLIFRLVFGTMIVKKTERIMKKKYEYEREKGES